MALMTYGVQMFQFTDANIDGTHMIKSIFYMIAVLIQFVGCYCILSQSIYDNVSLLRNQIALNLINVVLLALISIYTMS